MVGKVYGLDAVYSALNMVHSYVENGTFGNDLDKVLEVVSKWGVNLDRDSFINATLPGRRSLLILREILSNTT